MPTVDVVGEKRRPGRPSLAQPFGQLVLELLRGEPTLTTKQILARALAAGYSGAHSAFYSLVANVRVANNIDLPADLRAERRAQEAAERSATRARLAEEREAARRVLHEVDRRRKLEREEQRAAAEQDRLPKDPFHPMAADERSARFRVLARRWLDGRRAPQKSASDDRSRWGLHLSPAFGDLEPGGATPPRPRRRGEARGGAVLIDGRPLRRGALVAVHRSRRAGDRRAQPGARRTAGGRRLYRDAHDPRTTPFLERKEDIARLTAALTEPLRTMYVVAVRSGLRPSELVALEWSDISNDLRVMRVMRRFRWGKLSTPKRTAAWCRSPRRSRRCCRLAPPHRRHGAGVQAGGRGEVRRDGEAPRCLAPGPRARAAPADLVLQGESPYLREPLGDGRALDRAPFCCPRARGHPNQPEVRASPAGADERPGRVRVRRRRRASGGRRSHAA